MRSRDTTICMIFSILVVLTVLTSVQAEELKEVSANDILKQIEKGEDINLENVHIKGELNLGKIKLKTIQKPKWQIEYYNMFSPKELKIVESEITIKDSIFENEIDFSHTQFKKTLFLQGNSFLNQTNFQGVNFSSGVDFSNSKFRDSADFIDASFVSTINFENVEFSGFPPSFIYAKFSNYANFRNANFDNGAMFLWASFSGDADFIDTRFNNKVNFGGVKFILDAGFINASFNGEAIFSRSKFSSTALFSYSNFSNNADFNGVSFSDNADFSDASFSDNADFNGVSFSNNADFSDVSFSGYAFFNHTKFDNVKFSNAKIKKIYLYDTDFKIMSVSWSLLKDALVFDGATYIKLIKNFKDMEQFDDADNAYYQYRRQSQANKNGFSWITDEIWRIICGYGVRPINTILFGALIILVFSLIYYLGGSVSIEGAVYFSIVSFISAQSRDWFPEDRNRKIAHVTERLLGWLVLSLFLVTLAKVMIRP